MVILFAMLAFAATAQPPLGTLPVGVSIPFEADGRLPLGYCCPVCGRICGCPYTKACNGQHIHISQNCTPTRSNGKGGLEVSDTRPGPASPGPAFRRPTPAARFESSASTPTRPTGQRGHEVEVQVTGAGTQRVEFETKAPPPPVVLPPMTPPLLDVSPPLPENTEIKNVR